MKMTRYFDQTNPIANFFNHFEETLRPYEPILRWNRAQDTVEESFWLSIGSGWTNDAFNLRITMPAVSEGDFTLSVQGNRLVMRGERKEPKDFGLQGRMHYALPYGKFERYVELPDGLDLENLKAHLHHGVLDIRIPVLAEARVRAIPVTVDASGAAITGAGARRGGAARQTGKPT